MLIVDVTASHRVASQRSEMPVDGGAEREPYLTISTRRRVKPINVATNDRVLNELRMLLHVFALLQRTGGDLLRK